jgi:hypothetical protein
MVLKGIVMNDQLPKLYPVPKGYEAETPWGIFSTTIKIKDRAAAELKKFIEECSEESEAAPCM